MNMSRSALLQRLAATGPFGFGASTLGNLYRVIEDEAARATVDAAWEQGIRYFDTAPFYGFGLSERRLGDALRGRERDGFLLSTKVGRLLVPGEAGGERHGFHSPMPFAPAYDYSYDGVMRSVEASLHRLGLSRIDILYMHDLGRVTHGAAHDHYRAQAAGGLRAMAQLRDQGVVAGIGLGVNETEICADCINDADLDVLMIAGRYTLLNRDSEGFFETCRQRGIGIVGAGVFNSGILATGTQGGSAYYDYGPAPDDILRQVAAIEAICARHAIPLPAAALQFVARHPAVTQVVIGTGNAARIRQSAELAKQVIPAQVWRALEELDQATPLS
ncbi:MAG: aldo/keto reductase [Sphingomonadales bacterium]|nr:aldo/keto reductase [Sphingomonadales bacterium]MDE2170285.1 aldo/keto reductase [Sphingomonadales bacterium]